MNALLYLFSYLSVAGFLALTAWISTRSLRLPALSRVALGIAATPLVLAISVLAMTLVWPGAPRAILLAGPGIAVTVWAAFRARRLRVVANAIGRRLGRLADRSCSVAGLVLVAGFLLLAGNALWKNAREPIAAHDALVYFNEARHFAEAPRWKTFIDMTNPAASGAVVRGHTHTWFYPAFVAQALLAGEGDPGPGDDFLARIAVQANLLHLLVAVGGLTWTISGRRAEFSLGAMAAVASIPHIAYFTTATTVDAFRIIPLVLVTVVLSPRSLGRANWVLGAALLGAAGATHTLNLLFGPLIVLARLMVGLKRDQWRVFLRCYPGWQLACALPVAAYYFHLWIETGRFLGNGMHYFFYVGPLAAANLPATLSAPAPSVMEAWRTFQHGQGHWPVIVPCLALLIVALRWRALPAVAFVGLIFSLSVLLLFSGCWIDATQRLTHAMLQNFRYPLGLLIFGPPLVAGALIGGGIRWGAGCRECVWSRLREVFLSAGLVVAGGHQILQGWHRDYDTREYLAEGEWKVADLVSEHVGGGTDQWLTDRTTVAYYADRSPLFLYTPAGSKWLLFKTEAEVVHALRSARVKVVALSNLHPDWWPRTTLYTALSRPDVARCVELPRWEVFVLSLPAQPDAR